MPVNWILYFLFVLAASVGPLFTGQEPAPTAAPTLTPAPSEELQAGDEKTIQFWVGSDADYEDVGCGRFMLPVDTGIRRSGNTIKDLKLALQALFSPDQNHPEAARLDWVKELGLTVESITISNGDALVKLAGGLMGIGFCGDAVMQAQIIQTIFQFEAIERVMVTDGVMNLWEITDMSDMLTEAARKNYVYTRAWWNRIHEG